MPHIKRMIFMIVVFAVSVFATTGSAAGKDKYKIVVNKSTNCVTVYKLGAAEPEPYKAMVCSVGADDATPSGSYTTSEKNRWHPLFGNVYGQYVTTIDGDILFHSVYYTTTDPATLHADEFNKLGTAASMGCVRLSVADSKWIYDNCEYGTRVDIVDEWDDPFPKPVAIKLGPFAKYPQWDPTDPDEKNPWHAESVKITIKEPVKKIKSGADIELYSFLREGVKAYDIAGNEIHFDINADSLSTTVKGEYTVKYSATDACGNHLEASAVLKVE